MQLQQEPVDKGAETGIISITGPGNAGGSGALEHRLTFHAGLTVLDERQVQQPRLAQSVPNLQDGSWKTFEDGRMEVTWKLKPNLVWHDGKPLTADDFVFGTAIARDPDFVGPPPATGTRQLSEVVAVDPQTILVRFPQPFVGGNLGENVPPLPSHLLKEFYDRGEKERIQTSTYWTTDFVGLGPYKLTRWESGSFIEAQAFDQYVLGRPKTDRIFLRYYADANTMIAALLAGDIDVLPAGAQLDTNPLSTIRQAWGTTGGTIIPIPKGTRNLIPQLRDSAAPWSDLRARRAIAYALDKQIMVDSLQNGETSPAYTSLNPSLPAFQKLEQAGGQKYTYDLAQAQRLMTEAGWAKGGDGVYRNAAGQPFTFDITSSNQPKNVQEASAVAAQYTAFGITSNPTPYPASISNATEVRHTYKGMLIWPATSLTNAMEGFSALGIGTEQNRWRGANYGGYRNAEYDRLFGQFSTTLEADKSQDLIAQMMKIVADDVGAIPMYYVALSVVYRKGITGPSGAAPDQAANARNIHTWDIQ